MDNNNSQVKNKSRLLYVEPNEYAGLEAKRNNPDLENSTMLSWNPEELAMSVDLQVIIPRREDAGQVSYRIDVNGNSISFTDDSLRGRFVSYLGGTSFENNDQTFLTNNYTNISYQEIANAQTIDKESLGINNIDISFDSHFFPLVTMRFTDVRGSSLFMPSEEEFVESLKKQTMKDRQDVKNTATSFFRALFHFPYPRFLLSVKGFYGTKVTFQLAVSDFRSNLVPETGNFDITVQFIGYVYGLYTDLPFNLIMASPYYNNEYWENQKNNGTFRYVSDNGSAGGEIQTYIEFLSKMESKTVNDEALVGAEKTKSYLKTKEAIKVLKEIPDLYRAVCESAPPIEVGKGRCWTKRTSSNIITFIWGLQTWEKNDKYITEVNGGFHFNENLALNLYKAIQKIYNEYPEYKSLVKDKNIFLDSWDKKTINGNKVTDDILANDTEFKYKSLFSYVKMGSTLDKYFTFYKKGDPIDGDTGKTYQSDFYIETQKDLFKDFVGDDKAFKEDYTIFKPGSCLVLTGDPDFLFKIANSNGEYKPSNVFGLGIRVEEYCKQITDKINELEAQLQSQEREISEELKKVYENVIGFQPTVENYYRMLFAHIDCFMNYYNKNILGKVKDDLNKNKRTLKKLGITAKETDVPKKFGWDPNCDVFPFPAYYTKTSNRQNAKKIADYPGYAKDKEFSKIPEVTAINEILEGVKQLKFDYENFVWSNGDKVKTDNIFSPLSVLYGFNNPWNTIKLKGTDNRKDMLHIIYFYMSLLYADKVIGTNIYKRNSKNATGYDFQLANLLLDKIGTVKENAFIEDLAQFINRIKETDGLKYICDETSKDYHLNNFYVNDNKITLNNVQIPYANNEILLNVDDEALVHKPQDLDKSKYHTLTIGDYNSHILSFTNEGVLSGYSKEKLKNFNKCLIKNGDSSDYTPNTTLGEFCTSLLLSKQYSKPVGGIERPFVGINKNTKILLEKSGGGTQQSGKSTIIKDKLGELKNLDDITNNVLAIYYENDDTFDRHINFVGRKSSGIIELHSTQTVITDVSIPNGKPTVQTSEVNTGEVYIKDTNTTVNLFSGIQEEHVKSNTISSSYDTSEHKVTFDLSKSTSSYALKDLEYLLPLLFTDRCGGSIVVINNNKKMVFKKDDLTNISKYAFATYFLATLCGPKSLKKVTEYFTSISVGDNSLHILRKPELLYLGGSLYFAKNNLNEWSDTGNSIYRICDLMLKNGELGHGLLKADECNQANNGYKDSIDVKTIIQNNNFCDDIIDYFETWCNEELFGGKSMYYLLSQTSNVDNSEYFRLNGFFDNTDNWSIIQGYTTGGECEKWLTDLVYSYEFAINFREVKRISNEAVLNDSLKEEDNSISKTDIINFLQHVYDNLKAEKDKREKEKKDFEDGKTVTLTEDTKRATYYLLKNLYDKWLCTYTAKEFELHTPETDLAIRKDRFSGLNKLTVDTEYNNFIFIDQFYRDISSTYIMDSDLMAQTIKDIYEGRSNMDTYTLMSFMAEKNNLMLLALPVYTNMYNAQNVEQVFRPNTLYNMNSNDNCNGVGTTYVVMYTDEVSHKPGDFGEYDYDADFIDVADTINNVGGVDLELFSKTNNQNNSDLDYTVTAFGVTYSKQNQMYFKKVNVSMDNPKVTNESIKNMFILADGGSQGDTNQPIAIGQNIYSIYANRSYTCTVEMMGCMNIMPMMYFQLNNSPVFRGLYMIINVKHSIKAGDITTTFTGVRVNKYALPDVTDVMLNSSIFNKLQESDAWKDGKALDCTNDCPSETRITKFKSTLSINQYMKAFVKQMIELGWNKSAICGIGGACGAESGFKYWLVNVGEFKGEYSKSSANSTNDKPYVYGAGLIQWSLARKKTLVENVTNPSNVKLYTVHGASSANEFLVTNVLSLSERRKLSKKEIDSQNKTWTGGIENFTMPEQAMCINYELTHNFKNVGDTLKQLTQNTIDNVDKAVCTVYAKYVAGSSNTPGISSKEDACKISCKYSGQFDETTGLEKRIAYAEWMFDHWDSLSK